MKTLSCAAVIPKRCRAGLMAALVSLFASHPVHALPDAFPQYPLETGFAGTVPPNLMLILDDSGSMSWTAMPENTTWTSYGGSERYHKNPSTSYDTPYYRSYIKNSIYYNPEVTYKPWRTASPPPSEERLPPANFRSVSDHTSDLTGSLDLRNSRNSHFFVPKPGINNPGTNYNNYYKYRIASSTAPGSYNGGIVQRCAQLNCVDPHSWSNAITETPTGRSQQDELQNFANWFHYHSSRMKMAKAGASEAFGQLDENFRVGYDRINSNTTANDNNVNKIVYRIPHNINGGLFEGQNRIAFFNRLQQQRAGGGTPLRLALTRIGEYYKTLDPYKDSGGQPLSCRKNYAILTTDGEWNGADPVQPMKFPNLASIGHYYWKTDLRKDLTDNVPTSAEDSADWQHMNTFGISIGAGSNFSSAPAPTGGPWPKVGPNQGKKNIDDLAWAAGEGRGKFFLANNTDQFAKALLEAIGSIGERDASVSNVASSSSELTSDTLSFGTAFNSKTWLGDISAFKRDPQNNNELEPIWRLSTTFGAGGVNEHFSQRTVLTSYNSWHEMHRPSLFTKDTITDTIFGRSDGSAPVSVADNIDYLRGVQTLEKKNGGKLRERTHPLGDIVHSTPFYVQDTQTLYVGANDGMLHGIDGNTGKVLFSYVPRGINDEGMASLSSPNYDHRFLVDGNIDVSTRDVTPNKNILIAALGRGGRGVFALDVTEPETMGVANVLWDRSATAAPRSNNSHRIANTSSNMGYVLSRIRIRRGFDKNISSWTGGSAANTGSVSSSQGGQGKIWALVPNGIDSPSGKAVLFIYELNDSGQLTPDGTHALVASDQTDNGLMSIGIADIDGDGLIDMVYGGDLQGNLWRWDLRDGIEHSSPPKPTLLFAAGPSQPITGGITNARDPKTGELFIGFGTGKFISENDLPIEGGPSMQPVQSIYGLIDPINTTGTGNTPLIKRDDLQNRTIGDTKTGAINGKSVKVRDFEASGTLDLGKKGWYMDLPPNERVTSDAQIITGGAMSFVTVNPPDPSQSTGCESVAGTGFINMIDLFTGTAPIGVTYSSFAIDNGMPTAPAIQCDEASCKLVVCEGGKCNEELGEVPGPAPALSPVTPHRMQWRSLR